MKKIIKFFGLFSILSTFFLTNVNASTYRDYLIKDYYVFEDVFVTKKSSWHNFHDRIKMIVRASDNQFVYCIEPGEQVNEEGNYYGFTNNYETVAQMTIEEWSLVSKIAYYGYGYVGDGVDHTDIKWYAITQYMIWKAAPFGHDIYFTDKLKGEKIERFTEEIAEINDLIEKHPKAPSFTNIPNEMVIGESITLTDINGVLSKYEISNSNNVVVTKNGNNLTITALSTGEVSIEFSKKLDRVNVPPIVYTYDDESQRVFSVGYLDPVTINIVLNIKGGSVSISKKDSDTNTTIPQMSNATLEGAIYDLFDENMNLVASLTTDKNAYAKTANILVPGKTYILKERKPSKGYLLSEKEYKFSISSNNLNIHIDVMEDIIEQEVDFYKVIASGETGIMTPEPNITFDAYLKSSGEYYSSVTTNQKGFASIKLTYGTWVFKQRNTSEYHEKVQDFEITIDENTSEPVTKIIANAKLTAYLKLLKVDSESNKVIVQDGIKFKIKNTDTNEYVCQNITYPTQSKVCIYETTGGAFTTPYPLSYGNFQIEELEEQVIDGYVWNSEPLKFTINENSNFIYDEDYGLILEIQFENKQVMGEFELTKYGENYEIVDNKFVYNEILLDNVEYELYAHEDIYSADGTLIYEKDTLIDNFLTVEGKYKMTNLYLGKYRLIEKTTAINHILNSEPYIFELKYQDQYTDIVSLSFTFKNYLKKTNLDFTKLDFSTQEAIPNTMIEIYMESEDRDILVGSFLTDGDGKVLITDIPVTSGIKYFMIEKIPAEGYVINSEKMYFEFIDSENILKCTMTNKPITGRLEFSKIDSLTKAFLAGAIIKIENIETGEIIFEGMTNENEKIVIENVTIGKYRIYEISAPESYILAEPIDFEIKEDGEVINIVMENEKMIIEVPSTGKNNNILLISGILLTLATGVLICEKINKKRKKDDYEKR